MHFWNVCIWPVTYMTDKNVKNIPPIFDIFDIFNIFENSGIFLTFSTNVEIFDYFGSLGKAFAKVESKKKDDLVSEDFQPSKIFDCRLSRNTNNFWQMHGLNCYHFFPGIK